MMVSIRDNVPFPYRLRVEERIAKSMVPIQDTTHPVNAAIHAGKEEQLEKFLGTLASMAGGALITQLPKLLPRIASFVAGKAPGIAAKVATQAPVIAAGITNYAPKAVGAMNTIAANPKFGQAAHLVGTHLAVGAGLDYLTNKQDDANNKSFVSRKTNLKNAMRKSEDIMPYDINKVVRAQVINETELDKMGGGSLSVVFYEKKKDGKNRKIKKSVSEMSLHEFYELLNKAEIPTRQMAMTEGSRAGNIPTELVLGGVLGHGGGGEGFLDTKDEHGADLASRIIGNSSAYDRPKLSPHTGKPMLEINRSTGKPYDEGHSMHGKVQMETVAPGGISSKVPALMGAAAAIKYYPKISAQATKFGPALNRLVSRFL